MGSHTPCIGSSRLGATLDADPPLGPVLRPGRSADGSGVGEVPRRPHKGHETRSGSGCSPPGTRSRRPRSRLVVWRVVPGVVLPVVLEPMARSVVTRGGRDADGSSWVTDAPHRAES